MDKQITMAYKEYQTLKAVEEEKEQAQFSLAEVTHLFNSIAGYFMDDEARIAELKIYLEGLVKSRKLHTDVFWGIVEIVGGDHG